MHFNIFLLATILASANSQTSKLCGIRFTNRIVGGAESTENTWPWTVSLNYNFKHICGGTLINEQWVLTAAHCFPNLATSAYKIVLGTNDISNWGLNGTRSSISKIILHESYTGKKSFDIALVKLRDAINFTKKIFPACVPNLSENFAGERCYFAGWGHTFSGGSAQETLRELTQIVLTRSECSFYVKNDLDQKYCTGYPDSPEDTCQGDSGTGMLCEKNDGRWYVAGIVSYGLGYCDDVSVNVRVDYFSKWIDSVISSN